ncbi:MAG: sigma-70 family RNA polymerase sigma factor [Gemmatimonadaceae bacterium]|jgi:RNA polymerase sigma-70 factor (ECF subfamily)|nr:sigma-70 family RNA polymerase sigma factor [Gemmatimonadaceae bacterium]
MRARVVPSSIDLADGDDAATALLARVTAGDERALAALYDRYAERCHALAMQLVGDHNDADEVIEATFWQAWRTAGQFDRGRGTVASWLLTITRSRALDLLRTRKRESARTVSLDGDDQLDERISAVHDWQGDLGPETAERRTLVLRALAALPEAQRRVIELAYFAGLSQSEIAARDHVPLGTVKTRCRLALRALRESLGPLALV